ncbi:MAG: tRNA1(Val) (adenine(37)-N6)-methyltransferase, partial [Anaerovoracaceae bacterium]
MIRRDDTGFGGIKICQEPSHFCYGVDAVMIASFASDIINSRKKKPGSIVDLGTGNGIIPLIISHKTDIPDIRGIELIKENYDLAVMSARENGLADRISFVNADIADLARWDEGEGAEPPIPKDSVDAVVSNPPYISDGGGIKCAGSAKTAARHEVTAGLDGFLSYGSDILKYHGDFFMIHKAFRLPEIICAAREHALEAKKIMLVSGIRGEKPELVLIHFVKGGGRGAEFLPQLGIRER